MAPSREEVPLGTSEPALDRAGGESPRTSVRRAACVPFPAATVLLRSRPVLGSNPAPPGKFLIVL